MTAISSKYLRISIILSLLSFLLFILFYFIAALNYTGGSWAHPDHTSFSFFENYLCDLLDEIAINGSVNSANIYARISLGFLCLGLLLYWFHIPRLFVSKNKYLQIMRVSGMASMLVTAFLAADNHDIVTRLAGLLGAIAMILAFVALYKAEFKNYFYFGLLCLILILLNYYSYETGFMRANLPLFQKITTIAGLSWFILLNLKLYKRTDEVNSV